MPLPVPDSPKLSARNPHFGNKYSPLDEVLRVLKPLFEEGWTVTQSVVGETTINVNGTEDKSERMFITSVRNPEGNLVSQVSFPFFVGKEDPQGLGSALTYARRYGLCLAFNLAGEDDDDAEAAHGRSDETKAAPRRRPRPKKRTAE